MHNQVIAVLVMLGVVDQVPYIVQQSRGIQQLSILSGPILRIVPEMIRELIKDHQRQLRDVPTMRLLESTLHGKSLGKPDPIDTIITRFLLPHPEFIDHAQEEPIANTAVVNAETVELQLLHHLIDDHESSNNDVRAIGIESGDARSLLDGLVPDPVEQMLDLITLDLIPTHRERHQVISLR